MEIYKNLEIYKLSKALVLDVYQITTNFPKGENYGLTSQIRRAAISVVSNIVEGKVRNSDAEFNRYLKISLSSLAELEVQLDISYELKYLKDIEQIENKINLLAAKINSLIGKLKKK